ncbi:hypothetical protein [Cystobacter ferrugineus]|uniref:Glycosyltransferase n=1 Tax=Cystobacter ferrugineus TaxID=83449 RepID=A0A1L9BBK7_9BACT|nr:hypothetical protein [Cystobacter ferrugineus]OJH39654.1 hypothetical protein BON30_19410 [Cystobacter ferrugineus]
MRLVIAPEPAPWLPRLSSLLEEGPPAQVLAPWSLPEGPERWDALPSRLRAAWRRRTVPEAGNHRVWGLPGWWAVEAGMRWSGRTAAATFSSRFLLREWVARTVAPLLPARVETVVAPSLCAREIFAVARRRGARCVLVEDVPSLRQLHADLDDAASHHPEEAFLRNHRARAADVARQEAERVLADEIWVRGEFLREHLVAGGCARERLRELRVLTESAPPSPQAPKGAERVALLAGPALARSGLREALAVLDARPQWRLWVRPTEGTNLRELGHPRLTQVTAHVQRGLHGVDAVLALSWCESYPAELALAAARGIPIIATDRASGFLSCHGVPRGDVPAVLSRLDALNG